MFRDERKKNKLETNALFIYDVLPFHLKLHSERWKVRNFFEFSETHLQKGVFCWREAIGGALGKWVLRMRDRGGCEINDHVLCCMRREQRRGREKTTTWRPWARRKSVEGRASGKEWEWKIKGKRRRGNFALRGYWGKKKEKTTEEKRKVVTEQKLQGESWNRVRVEHSRKFVKCLDICSCSLWSYYVLRKWLTSHKFSLMPCMFHILLMYFIFYHVICRESLLILLRLIYVEKLKVFD